MQHPIDELMEEHDTILKVLSAIRTAARTEVDLSFYGDVIDFIVNYADGCHHGKEEERLFPLLEKRGIPREGGPIGVMCAEHVIGRDHVANMRAHFEARDREGLRSESLAYAALLEQHIEKENMALFQMGRMAMAPGDADQLRREFDEVDPKGEIRDQYVGLAEKLRNQADSTA